MDDTSLDKLKRPPQVLVEFLCKENTFPHGAFLLTGTGIVPSDDFSLVPGDEITIDIDDIGSLTNFVA